MTTTLTPDEITRIRSLRREGMSIKAIARRVHRNADRVSEALSDMPLNRPGRHRIRKGDKLHALRRLLAHDQATRERPLITLPRLSILEA